MKQITDKSIYLWVLKWLPVIGTALIASHYAMLPLGYKSFIIDYITDVSLFAWIYLLRLCSTAETAGDDAWQIQASAEIRRVSEQLAMAINGRRAKSPNTIV